MADNLESLSDLVETRAAQHGTPRRRLWEWALTAIQDGRLDYGFSEDDFFIRTWRRDHKRHADNRGDHTRSADEELADLVREKIRDALSFLRLFDTDPCKRWGHFRRLMIAAAVFDEWLKEHHSAAHPKQARPRGSRGPQKGTVGRYREADRGLFAEIDRLIPQLGSPHAAALQLAWEGKIKGQGSEESRATRLARKYRQHKKLDLTKSY